MPRRRRSRTPPRRYSTEPLRPSTAPARTTATSPRSLLDPRRTRPAVTAIAEADVRIPQALAQTQHRRTSSGGWFRSSRNRPVTAPPVAEIVLPTTTPVASRDVRGVLLLLLPVLQLLRPPRRTRHHHHHRCDAVEGPGALVFPSS